MDLWMKRRKERVERTESSIEICTLPCVKYIANCKLFSDTESPAWCSAMTWRGGMRGWEEGSRGRAYMCTYSWFTLLYTRNYYNIEKQLYSNFLKRIICLNNHASLSQPVICGQLLTHHDGWSSSIKINPYIFMLLPLLSRFSRVRLCVTP